MAARLRADHRFNRPHRRHKGDVSWPCGCAPVRREAGLSESRFRSSDALRVSRCVGCPIAPRKERGICTGEALIGSRSIFKRMANMAKIQLLNSGTRGRPFANGNPGGKPGSKNRTTILAAALLEGDAQELVRKAVELAKAGNVVMLKFLLTRTLPRERPINLDLPRMEFADDAVGALGLIMRAVSEGSISPSEGAALAGIVKPYTEAIDLADVVKRLEALEAQIRGPLT